MNSFFNIRKGNVMDTIEALKDTFVIFGILALIIGTLLFFVMIGLFIADGIGALIGFMIWIFITIFIILKLD